MQQLTPQLGLARLDVGPEMEDAAQCDAGEDVPQRCPVLVTEVQTTPRADLDARAQGMIRSAPAPQPAASSGTK